MPEPSVSALICVRDGEAHLGEAIDTVLGQTSPPAELIVVEDSSTDRTVEIARSYAPRVRLLQTEPRGLGSARNVAVGAASGDLIAFLDSDDLWEPRKLELQLAAFAADPSLDYCFTYAREFASAGDAQRFSVRPEPVPFVTASALCARRDAIGRAGGFEAGFTLGDILGWLARARDLGMREVTLPDVLVHRRIHAGNTTRLRRHEMGDYARVLKASLDRRRAAR